MTRAGGDFPREDWCQGLCRGRRGMSRGPEWRRKCGSRWFHLARKHSKRKDIGKGGIPGQEPACGVLRPPLVGHRSCFCLYRFSHREQGSGVCAPGQSGWGRDRVGDGTGKHRLTSNSLSHLEVWVAFFQLMRKHRCREGMH